MRVRASSRWLPQRHHADAPLAAKGELCLKGQFAADTSLVGLKRKHLKVPAAYEQVNLLAIARFQQLQRSVDLVEFSMTATFYGNLCVEGTVQTGCFMVAGRLGAVGCGARQRSLTVIFLPMAAPLAELPAGDCF